MQFVEILEEGADRVSLADVCRQSKGRPSHRPDNCFSLPTGGFVDIGQDHEGSLGRKPRSNRTANARAGTCDDGDFILESHHDPQAMSSARSMIRFYLCSFSAPCAHLLGGNPVSSSSISLGKNALNRLTTRISRWTPDFPLKNPPMTVEAFLSKLEGGRIATDGCSFEKRFRPALIRASASARWALTGESPSRLEHRQAIVNYHTLIPIEHQDTGKVNRVRCLHVSLAPATLPLKRHCLREGSICRVSIGPRQLIVNPEHCLQRLATVCPLDRSVLQLVAWVK